ncbi:Centromere protein Mis12 [Dillenia turbinata]|uniref:Centromere protein Mis12 n=1 Tax=Dillenia turbinata TaxID=194707 RepID=A0AAN8UQ35_9MAGN
MEGSEGGGIFESLNLNPQLFINEVLNSVNDLVDGAFDYFHQEASKLLKTEGTDRSEELARGIVYIRNMVQSVLDKRLDMWEKYCLRHCFGIPEGFRFPDPNASQHEIPMDEDALRSPELDAELDSLRIKLAKVGEESEELQQELRALERQTTFGNQISGSVNEVLQLYENSSNTTFQEVQKAASQLRTKLEKLKSRKMEEMLCSRMETIFNQDQNFFANNVGKVSESRAA